MANLAAPRGSIRALGKAAVAALVAGSLSGCALPPLFQDPAVQRFLVEKSAEIGSQDARVFELKIEAAKALIERRGRRVRLTRSTFRTRPARRGRSRMKRCSVRNEGFEAPSKAPSTRLRIG